jgi:hypothetical protein
MHAVLMFLLWIVVIGLIVSMIVWASISNSHYTWELLKPGQIYTVHNRKYTFPNLDAEGPTYLLKDNHIADLRHLLLLTSATLAQQNIKWWLTGGSLIGAERHKAIPMPFDDDIDIAVEDKHRAFLFSAEFAQVAFAKGLKVIFLTGSSSKRANRTGACVRVQLLEGFATLDIFFWQTSADGSLVCKLDGWTESESIPNAKEQFPFADVFPIQVGVILDDMVVNLPANPANLLIKQYSKGVFQKIIARSTFVSHLLPFMMGGGSLWTEIPPG